MDYERKRYELIQIIEPYCSWEDDGTKNQKAREGLTKLYKALCKVKPQKFSHSEFPFRYTHVVNLLLAKEAFISKLYCRGCHEIQTTIHHYRFWDEHILLSLKKIVKEYME